MLTIRWPFMYSSFFVPLALGPSAILYLYVYVSQTNKTNPKNKDLILVCSLIHFFIVVTSIVQPDGTGPLAEFNNVFDPAGDPQAAFVNMVTNYPNFVAEEWSHVLTWDLFVGRWIWLDGLARGIIPLASPSILLCNLIGPPGLLLYAMTCLVSGKGLPPNPTTTIIDDDEK
jgi:hypothetical protein